MGKLSTLIAAGIARALAHFARERVAAALPTILKGLPPLPPVPLPEGFGRAPSGLPYVTYDTRGGPVPQRVIAHAKTAEGFRRRAYLCPAGVPTIGYGCTSYENGMAVRLSDAEIDEARADALLAHHVAKAARIVDGAARVPLTKGQRDAFVDMVFNIGPGGSTKDGIVRLASGAPSTFLRKLNEGDYAGASAEISRWDKATVAGHKVALRGLTTRRAVDRAWFDEAP